MGWDFETDPAYQAKLDWADEFVREEVEPLDVVFPGKAFWPPDDVVRRIIDPLRAEAKGAVEHAPVGQRVEDARELEPAQHRLEVGGDDFGVHGSLSPWLLDVPGRVNGKASARESPLAS